SGFFGLRTAYIIAARRCWRPPPTVCPGRQSYQSYLRSICPIVWIGYDPVWVYGMVSVSLTYQFFVHTELVPHIAWLEWFVNTPSAHRVHHASNPEYLDKNYGGVLLIWDHLFGSYQSERPDLEIRYGLVHPRSSDNPFVVAYEDFWQMIKDVFGAGSVGKALARMLGPP